MMAISGRILKIFGWKITGEFPDLKKSVVVFAPHTSAWDFILGILYMNEKGVKNYSLVKKEVFFFPINIIMNALGAIPVDRKNKNSNVASQVVLAFNKNNEFNLIVSAEGSRRKVSNWKRGFYHIAQAANVPIVIGYIDYEMKEVGIEGIVSDTSNLENTMKEINMFYKNVKGKYPENFVLDKRYS